MEKYKRVQVTDWPGFRDFSGDLIMSFEAPAGHVSVVKCDLFMCDEEMHIVPSEYVTQVTN